ncbi:MAG TPA: 50S ribosomal protein L29 [Candidatus Borkfalkia faecavium]|uniref:Large ribosomal subunit protein uL29 n=1 Tax=Candidatus Borkfalkia faecavium TaxID=2838508 RepID=A0A9D1W0Y8_9FIRM|nr:50S ribosomal protein L29 [Candidatus Borkfalkia faecavium]
MKGNELHNMTDQELKAKLGELKSELFNLRFRHASGQLDNPMAIVACKKDIARVNTVIREREIKSRA